MAVSDALKRMRSQDYGSSSNEEEPEEESPGSSRVIQLTDDEMKSMGSYNIKPGEEIEFKVTGKLEEDGHMHVMSVEYNTGTDMDDAAKVAGIEPPPMTQPSPS